MTSYYPNDFVGCLMLLDKPAKGLHQRLQPCNRRVGDADGATPSPAAVPGAPDLRATDREGGLYQRLCTNLSLCRHLAAAGGASFAQLRVKHLGEVVSSLLTAPPEDLLRRRRQVQRAHRDLRGFLRHLQRHGLLHRDLGPRR